MANTLSLKVSSRMVETRPHGRNGPAGWSGRGGMGGAPGWAMAWTPYVTAPSPRPDQPG
jgi:hypothetical protein